MGEIPGFAVPGELDTAVSYDPGHLVGLGESGHLCGEGGAAHQGFVVTHTMSTEFVLYLWVSLILPWLRDIALQVKHYHHVGWMVGGVVRGKLEVTVDVIGSLPNDRHCSLICTPGILLRVGDDNIHQLIVPYDSPWEGPAASQHIIHISLVQDQLDAGIAE